MSLTFFLSVVVGYSSTSIVGDQWYMIASQFKDVGGADSIDVQKLVSMTGISAVPRAQKDTQAPQMQVWNGINKYDFYYYVTDANGATGPAWMKNNNPKMATDKIPLGQGFWFKVPATAIEGSASASFAGEVKTDASKVTFTLGDYEWKMIGNAFPVALTDKMISFDGISAVPKAQKNDAAPQMQVWNVNKYDFYYYVTDASGATGPAWMKNNNPKMATGVFIPVGAACWFKAYNVGTVTFDINAK